MQHAQTAVVLMGIHKMSEFFLCAAKWGGVSGLNVFWLGGCLSGLNGEKKYLNTNDLLKVGSWFWLVHEG